MVKNLKLHFRNSHPELMKDALGESAPSKPQPEPQESPQQPPQPDLLGKLKAFGIEPEQIMATLSPLVEKAVVKTLEKMQLGEAINKKIGEVETRLSQELKTTLEPFQQAAPQPSGGKESQDTQARDIILQAVARKFLGGDSGGSLESLLAQQEKLTKLVDVFTKPYRDAEEATLRRVNLVLGIGAKAGLKPEDTMKRMQGVE
jgi:hypothetical protein